MSNLVVPDGWSWRVLDGETGEVVSFSTEPMVASMAEGNPAYGLTVVEQVDDEHVKVTDPGAEPVFFERKVH